MTRQLFFQAILKFSLGVFLVGLLLFLPAGTLYFPNGWLFMGVLFIPIFVVGIILMCKDPALLKERLDAKETQKGQDLVIKLSGLMFVVGFVIAGLGFRFGWYTLPYPISILAIAVFLAAYGLFAKVLRQNAYLSRTIKVQDNQTVVDTCLYSIVRHPMYSATLLLFLSMPLILGSLYAFVVFLAYPFLIAFRIKKEEELLEKELDGYIAYKHKVKYRLIPLIW